MNRKTKKRTILLTLAILLSTPFIYWQSQKKVELYVNPAFKISDYDSFYIEYEPDSVIEGAIEDTIRDILRPGGLKWDRNKTQNTLYIMLKIEKGFIFPPHIGHFNPQIFYPKTLLVEIYNSKAKEQLLLRLYTWRGVFSDGYGIYAKEDFLKKGLSQAGWKEKKEVSVSGVYRN